MQIARLPMGVRLSALLAILATVGWCTPARAQGARVRSVIVVFAHAGERELQALPGASLAIVSATEGSYSTEQLALDISQGNRISGAAYHAPLPRLALRASGVTATARLGGWGAVLERAREAPAQLEPGLLASLIAGGGAYAGPPEGPGAALVADRAGRIAAVSTGPPASLAARAGALARSHRLVLASLPGGAAGLRALDSLAAARGRNQLLLVVSHRQGEGALQWVAAAGLPGGGGHELTSTSTNQRGLVIGPDVSATVLVQLGLAVPSAVRGYPLRTAGALNGAALRGLIARLRVIGGRRLPALAWMLIAWAALALACAHRPRTRAWALRVGGLGLLWAPVVSLLPALLEPSAAVEYTLLALLCPALGALTDRLLRWPRALLAPAAAALLALSADALLGTQLLLRSLLGPDPQLGARFFGIGNELKSALAVLVLAAVTTLLPPRGGRRAALTLAIAGALLALLEGSARIGAAVGGAVLVSCGFAVAAAAVLPAATPGRRALAVLLAPLLVLLGLAGLDLASAHGAGQFSGSVLDAHSLIELRDLVVRRYEAAWRELADRAMPLATALSAAAGVWSLSRARRVLAPVGASRAWRAALWGAFAAGGVGALVEDSGPVLLVAAIFTAVCVGAYLWGRPRASACEQVRRRSPRTIRVTRSHALRPPAAPVR